MHQYGKANRNVWNVGFVKMEPVHTYKRRKRIKLIFNPASGANKESPLQLMDVIKEMQAWKLVPEPYLTEPDTDYDAIVRDALEQGIRTFAVCGGDGTVSAMARALVDQKATLGIIPNGTQNNIALSLGIPPDTKAAVSLLRTGRRVKADVGMVSCGDMTMPFIEVCSVGLFSALFPAGDDIQHGDISRLGEFISTLTQSTPSKIHLLLDGGQEAESLGHVVMVANMPYIGRRYRVSDEASYRDGFLDVIFCAEVPKLDLMLGYMLKLPEAAEDPRIKRYRVRSVVIDTHPEMPVMADSIALPRGLVKIGIKRQALNVMAGFSNTLDGAGEEFERQKL